MQLLLVDSDAAAVAERLAPLVPHARVTPASSAVAARAYLAGGAFDAVACHDASDAATLQALADVLGLGVAVQTYAEERDLANALAPRLTPSPETAVGAPDEAPRRLADADVRAALEAVRDELARLAHALNNPLAVIAGNAQLGREIALATGADAEVTQALESVDAAAGTLGAMFREIGALRTHIVRLLDDGGEGA